MKQSHINLDTAKQFEFAMYIFIILTTIIASYTLYFFSSFTNQIYAIKPHNDALGGFIDISGHEIEKSKPIELFGEWRKYSNVYITVDEVDYDIFNDYTYAQIPIHNLLDSFGSATFQLLVNYNIDAQTDDPIMLGIPFLKSDISVYANGKKVLRDESNLFWNVNSKHTAMYDIEQYYDKSREYQEIIISINKSEKDTDLYNRDIWISTKDNFLGYQNILFTLEFIFLGIIIVVITISINYIASRPYYNISTLLNLFDIFLLIDILFSSTNVPNIFASSLPEFGYSDLTIYRVSIVSTFLMLLCLNCLTQVIFDPKKTAPSFFDLYFNLICISCAIISGIYPKLYAYIGIFPLILTLTLLAIGVLVRYYLLIKSKKCTKYVHCNFIITLFTGIVIVFSSIDFLYGTFDKFIINIGHFIVINMHLSLRAYEYRKPFNKIIAMNNELEQTVEERTKQLKIANEELQEIATKDALTKAYNRLYFENIFIQELENFKQNYNNLATLHLAMFDLDNFKKINDTFGHAEGDAQLIEVTKIVNEIIPQDVAFARIGGEEFILLFVDYDDDEVFEFIEIIRCSLERESFKHKHRTTGSFGVVKANFDYDRKTFFSNADECLYHSKTHGKNCISYLSDGQIAIKKSDEINI